MAVYVDLLLLVNFSLNAWALWVTSHLTGSRRRRAHLGTASLCGALYAFGALTPWASLFLHPLSKLLLASTMVYLAFRPCRLGKTIQLLAWFLLVSFVTAGVILGLYTLLLDKEVQGAMLAWGDLPLWVVVLALVFLYVSGGRFLGALENRLVHVANSAHLRIAAGEKEMELEALVDSGNQLVDPLTGRPVVVVALRAVSHILPPEIVALSQVETNWEIKLEQLAANEWAQRLHFVPFHAVGSDRGVLLGLRADHVEVVCNGRINRVRGIILAISPVDLSQNDDYQALVPLRLLPTKGAARVA